MNKKIIAAITAAVLAVYFFCAYPSVINVINRIAYKSTVNSLKEDIKTLGGEIYSEKGRFYTEMDYYEGYSVNFFAEYVIVFKCSKTAEEMNNAITWEYFCPASEADKAFFAQETAKKVKLPENTDGYYLLCSMASPKIDEAKATKLHTYFYADKENRERMNEYINYYK